MHRIIAWGQGIGGLVILAFAVAGNAEPPSISSTEATQILKSFGLRVAACNPDSPIEMTDIQTARAAMTHLVDMRAKAIAIYPVKGRFVGHCTGGTAASGRIDTFTISGKFQTNLYKDDFGDWKHTPVLRPECEQVRTSYQITGQPAVPANDQSICDYTAPR